MSRTVRRPGLGDRAREVAGVAVETGRELWLASLGTALVAGEEGRRAFDHLVSEGRRLEQEQRAIVNDRVEEIGRRVREVSDRVQGGVHDAMAATLHRLGIPTHDDIQTLLGRVEQLSAKVRTFDAR